MPLKFLRNPGEDASHIDAMRRMIDTYSVDMPHLSGSSSMMTHGGDVVLLTGTTGALGSELLVDLLANERVSRVYAYNRPALAKTILERHQRTFADRGLHTETLLSEKLVFLEGDTRQPRLGLTEDLYEEVRTSATKIIHSAWHKAFMPALNNFEPNIHGLRRLIDFAFSCSHSFSLRFLFISSVFVGQAWPHTAGWFPEESLEDPQWSVGLGYGEGKYVSERIIVKAAENGLQACSMRIGQISGRRANGAWSMNEWLPMMVKSGVALGCLPEAHGLISCVPFEAVSNVILDAALAPPTTILPTGLGVVHPHGIPWAAVFEHVSRALQEAHVTEEPLPLVPISDWVQKLAAEAKGGMSSARSTLNSMPALKLLRMFTEVARLDEENRAIESQSEVGIPPYDAAGLVILGHGKTLEISRTLRNQLPLGGDDAKRWVGYWKKHGYFAEAARL